MKFHQSQLNVNSVIPCNGDEVIHATESKPCSNCGELCEWVSISFGSFFCSGGCLDKYWEGFFKSLNS